ncbi:hypothetical protein QFC21_003986 [Naganishia friedmannii]|uniref:Uncharacterized protein n=1 Tax=Naganishia friedmannii TaxID=89922 RepID=A0ACC2VLP1_9TREE|nr:hypothetical protein QFC21_003986 [Naganishia friedmannii]
MDTLSADQEEQITSTDLPFQQPENPRAAQAVEQPASPPHEPLTGPSSEQAVERQWYETELEHHASYIDQWSAGAVTEGSHVSTLFGFPHITNPNPITDDFPVVWTSAEKLQFFGSIARRSRWQPDLIAQDIGTKSQVDVIEYIVALEEERSSLEVFSKPRKDRLRCGGWIRGLAPAAREMKESRIEWEEKMAERLVAEEGRREGETPSTIDSQTHIQRLTDIVKMCRKEANAMDKAPNKDLDALRPKRLQLLVNTKRQLDEAVETFKMECTRPIIDKVLRACDVKGLQALDVVVQKALAANKDDPTSVPVEQDVSIAEAIDVPTDMTSSTIPTNNVYPLPVKKKTLIERHEEDLARMAYLAQFPVKQLNVKDRMEKTALIKRLHGRNKRMQKMVVLPIPSSVLDDTLHFDLASGAETSIPAAGPSFSTASPADEDCNIQEGSIRKPIVEIGADASVVDIASQSHIVLVSKNHKTRSADHLERLAAKVAKEAHEKARLEYLSGVPGRDLTKDMKREKRTLKNRIGARERKRLKAAEDAGLESRTSSSTMLHILQADVRPSILSAKGSKRKRDEDSDEAETPLSKRRERHRAEQDRLAYLVHLRMGKTNVAPMSENSARKLTEEEKTELKTLRSRIKARNWYRRSIGENLGIAAKEELELRSTSMSQQGYIGDRKAPPLSSSEQDVETPAGLEKVKDPETEQKIKRKRGRPRKMQPEEKEEKQLSEFKPVRDGIQRTYKVSLDCKAGQSGRTNQDDDNGAGVTYFRLDLKRYYDNKVDEVADFTNAFNAVEFEMEFRALLKNGANEVSRNLKESRYTPQIFVFAIQRRMELLSTQHLINLLNPDSRPREVTANIASLVVSKVPRPGPPKGATIDFEGATSKSDKLADQSKVPDAEWVDLVDASDDFTKEDALAEDDEYCAVDDDMLVEVDRQQDIIDTLDDEEYEERLVGASRRPNNVKMDNTAIPVLEHDVFDWLTYEWTNQSRWIKKQKAIRDGSLPRTWGPYVSATARPGCDTSVPKHTKRNREAPRRALRATIYRLDMHHWQRVKRSRDPMYRLGGVHNSPRNHKSAVSVAGSEEEDSETEIEEDGNDDGNEEGE